MTADEASLTAEPARPQGRHRRAEQPGPSRLPAVTAVLLVLCLVPAGLAAFFAVDRPTGTASPASLTGPNARAATVAATRSVVNVLSYSYKSITADVRRAEADATGVFLKQYRSTADQLLSESRQEKAIVQATVGSTGVVSAGPGNVVVLLYVDQATVRQPRGPSSNTTRIDQSRVRVTMTKVGPRWLISQLAAL